MIMLKDNKETYIFNMQEAAIAYALSAERIFGSELDFLNKNKAVTPIFVSLLFQSVEISIKHAGIKSGLFTEKEARGRERRLGHGIKELAALAVEKLGGSSIDPIINAMTCFNAIQNSGEIIRLMIAGIEFEKTRTCYSSRCLGYAQVADRDFALIDDISTWISAVKETASNLTKTINILSQWKASHSQSKHFAIWFNSGFAP